MCKFLHFCFGRLGRLMQVGANLGGFSGISKPPVKTRWLVTGALVPSRAASVRGRGAATNLRLKTLQKEALNGPPLVTFGCVPALDVKNLPRHVPRPPTLTYVLLTYVLEMPEVWSSLILHSDTCTSGAKQVLFGSAVASKIIIAEK